jgi:hypothetical protein
MFLNDSATYLSLSEHFVCLCDIYLGDAEVVADFEIIF